MSYTPYYAPYSRPITYYNPSIPQDMPNMQNNQQYQQMPTQQPQMQQIMQQMPMAQQMPANEMIWVLSEVEAQSYPVAPNNSVILWDKNNDVIYIKSANMQGIPSMRILDYTERAENAPKRAETHECKFVSVEQFKAVQTEIEALRGELNELKTKPKTKSNTKSIDEVEDNG
jgi:hypothetical protein